MAFFQIGMLSREIFESLFKEHYHALNFYARRFVIDKDLAGDIVQEVFYNLWKIRGEVQPAGSMRSYLFSAVYYKCLNHIKHEKLKVSQDDPKISTTEEFRRYYQNEIINYPESLLTGDSRDKIRSAIDELPDQCRRVFVLSRKFGMKNREIAEFLEISLKVVEKHVSRALVILRDRLTKK